MSKSKVYFSKTITPEAVITMYEELSCTLPGKVAVKVHSGEVGNKNFIRPAFWKPMVGIVRGTIVECNTAYGGKRSDSKEHWNTMKLHGWTDIAPVDIMDEDDEIKLRVQNGKCISVNYVGSHLINYDSMLVLTHFKGHPMGGFGGALKNISIGVASAHGKAYIHGEGVPENIWTADHDAFLDSMADAAESIVTHFGGNMAYINVMSNLSVDCDCAADAAAPEMGDIGILASLDPVALDQACIDLVYQSDDPGKVHLIERIESRNGIRTIESATAHGLGSKEYDLVAVKA